MCGDVEDTVLWTETKSGKFLVKSLYNALELGNSSSFPSRSIWNIRCSPRLASLLGRQHGIKL